MHVHAGAGEVVEGFGHEAGLHAVFVRHTFDQALVAYGLVHRQQGVAMLQSDFDLAGGVFGNGCARRDALSFAGAIEVREKRFDLFQLAQAIDLGAPRTATVAV
ncbi:hypothetical protein D3C72_1470080 [compost metagenome]